MNIGGLLFGAIIRGTQTVIFFFKLAAIYEFAGRYRDAIDEYERYIQLGGPESAKARSRVRHIFENAFE